MAQVVRGGDWIELESVATVGFRGDLTLQTRWRMTLSAEDYCEYVAAQESDFLPAILQ